VAIAGLKAPSQTDREAVFGKAATAADPCDREFELGWVYVVPAYRLHGLGRDLCRKLLAGTSACGVFAKTRTDNARMVGILHDLGFRRDGAPIPRRSEKLHLYLGSGSPAA
jgi:GNAT superfamily N-acetyltransferase